MISSAFIEYLATVPGAATVETGGNHPFVADDESAAWVVLSGSVDLFLVRLIDGNRTGARIPIVQIDAGQTFFGVRPQSDHCLLAVGTSGTRLVKVPITALRQAVDADTTVDRHDALAELVDDWIRSLQGGMHAPYPPRECQRILKPGVVALDAAGSLNVTRGVLWAQIRGKTTWMGADTLPDGTLLPLTAYSWVRAVDAAQVTLSSTRDALTRPEAWSAITRCQDLMFANAVAYEHDVQVRDRDRVVRRARSEGAVLDEALHDVASVFARKSAGYAYVTRFNDALLDACEIVGLHQGLTIRRPARSTEGLAADALWRIARASHCQTRQVTLNEGWWERDNGPIVGFLSGSQQPVALVPLTPHRYVLVDPVARRSAPVDAKVAASLDPEAHMLYRNLPERPLVPIDLLKFGLRTTWRDLLLVLAMGVAVGILAMATPVGIGLLTSRIIPSGQPTELAALAGALLAASLGSAGFDLVRQFALLRMETRMEYEVQAGLFTRLLMLPAPFFRRFTSGDLSNRLLGIIQVRSTLSAAGTQAILGGLFSFFSFLLLFYYSGYMAIVAAVLVIVYVLVSAVVAWFQVRQQREILDLGGDIQGLVLQLILGIAKIRVAGVETRAFREWAERFSRQRKLSFKNRLLGVHYGAVSVAYPTLSSLVLFGYLAWHSYSTMDTGQFLAFNSAYGQFLSSLVSLTATWIQTQQIVPLVDRARPIMSADLEVDESKPDPGRLEGAIEVRTLSFRYEKDGPLILDDVEFKAEPGEMIAIVGPSGSGKSTLLRMLLGFERPESGDVLYDGQSLAQLDVQSVRRQIGVVLQDGKLQPGDIFGNIVGSTLLTQDDAWEAARIAGIEQDIKALPMGMHTVLSEGASTFSGGQRQRLMIARAVVGRPRYIFLDEATSALDASVQEQVSKALDALQATRVVIAHRLSTIRSAHRIYVLRKGRVEQVGSYEELMDQPGLFRELARRQLA